MLVTVKNVCGSETGVLVPSTDHCTPSLKNFLRTPIEKSKPFWAVEKLRNAVLCATLGQGDNIEAV